MTRQGHGIFSLALCCVLMTSAAQAQTVSNPNNPGAVTPGVPSPSNPQPTACLKTNPFDLTSADFVMQKVLAAGYTNIRGLYKGCDAIWRGHALQNGLDVSIMVTPTGRVLKAGY